MTRSEVVSAALAGAAAMSVSAPVRRVERLVRGEAADRPTPGLPAALRRWWSAVWGRRTRPAGLPPGLALELVAAVLTAGAPPGAAIALVADAMAAVGDPQAAELAAVATVCAGGPGAHAVQGPLATLLRELTGLSGRTGLPLAGLVRAAAEDQRRARATAQAVAARRLAVLLVLPTGLCLLPAFLLLGVVPLVIGLLTAS